MNDVLNEIKLEEDSVYGETFDITEEDKIISFIKSVEEKLGGVDVLINCAGANTARSAVEHIKHHWYS